MNILFSLGTMTSGGAERVVSILANKLVENGHNVEILLYYDAPIWYELHPNVVIQNDEDFIGNANPLKHILFRHKYFKQSKADLIVSFIAPINMINIVASVGTGKKIIVADRNDPRYTPFNPAVRYLRNFLYRFSDGVVLQSTQNKAYFSSAIQKKSRIIMNPVDLEKQIGAALKAPKRNEIVSVARVIEQKNPDVLIKAFYEFQKLHPEYSLTMYGNGNKIESMKDMAKELGIGEKVNIPGAVQDVFEKIKYAKMFVLASKFEGMPNALIEAMCLGIPVISTKVSGAVDLIHNGENGLLVDCNDVSQLYSAMLQYAENEDEATAYAKEAIKTADLLSVNKITAEWLDFIESIVTKQD